MVGPRQHLASRRLVLFGSAATGAVIATSGCEVRSPLDARPTESAAPAPVDPDLALRDAAQLAIVTQLDLVTSTLAARPRLSARLQPLADLHSAHADALPGAPARESAKESTPVPAGTWGDIVRGERALSRQLAGMAQRAESGGFARLLASMAAAIDQRLAREEPR